MSNYELCLLGTKGSTLRREVRNIEQLVIAPRSAHSVKPEEVQDRIDLIYGNSVNKLELFARRKRKGWACWGNEVEDKLILKPRKTRK
jgi:N6-adenosine-specific RNA methylase IME4